MKKNTTHTKKVYKGKATAETKLYRALKQSSVTDVDDAISEYDFDWDYRRNDKYNFRKLAKVMNKKS